MAAGPIGSCWHIASWTDTCWTANTWEDASGIAAVFGDLTTLFAGYVRTLRNNATVPPGLETTTLVAKDVATVRGATHSPDDLPTAYAEYLS